MEGLQTGWFGCGLSSKSIVFQAKMEHWIYFGKSFRGVSTGCGEANGLATIGQESSPSLYLEFDVRVRVRACVCVCVCASF